MHLFIVERGNAPSGLTGLNNQSLDGINTVLKDQSTFKRWGMAGGNWSLEMSF